MPEMKLLLRQLLLLPIAVFVLMLVVVQPQIVSAEPARCYNFTDLTVATCVPATDTDGFRVSYTDGGPRDTSPATCYKYTMYGTVDIGTVTTGEPFTCSTLNQQMSDARREAGVSDVTRAELDADCDPDAAAGEVLDESTCGIIGYLKLFINSLSALVGVVVVIMLIVGGIQYASSADDPQKVQASKKRIFNALLALVIYIFMFAFLQWLVPGGIF